LYFSILLYNLGKTLSNQYFEFIFNDVKGYCYSLAKVL